MKWNNQNQIAGKVGISKQQLSWSFSAKVHFQHVMIMISIRCFAFMFSKLSFLFILLLSYFRLRVKLNEWQLNYDNHCPVVSSQPLGTVKLRVGKLWSKLISSGGYLDFPHLSFFPGFLYGICRNLILTTLPHGFYHSFPNTTTTSHLFGSTQIYKLTLSFPKSN